MNVFEYVTLPSEVVHLVRQMDDDRTLCGRPVPDSTPVGDETVSGIAATCKSCRRLVGAQS